MTRANANRPVMPITRRPLGPSCTITRVEAQGLIELYLACAPDPFTGNPPDVQTQIRSMYANLEKALLAEGASLGVVLSERLFLSDIDRHFALVARIRKDVYRDLRSGTSFLPATSFIQQPPCSPGQLCALQAWALVPTGHEALATDSIKTRFQNGSIRTLTFGDTRHVCVANITAVKEGQTPVESFTSQAEAMFRNADDALAEARVSWKDVLRTWFWLSDIDRDYSDFNDVRNTLYKARQVSRLPASTGIAGIPYPSALSCAMDLYAYQSKTPVEIATMHAKTMNEAPAYGSAFSRGLKLASPRSTVLFISGTASIDTTGEVVHIGDVENQVRKTCENIETLLDAQGASVDNLVSLISYLKSADSLAAFKKVLGERSWPGDLPNTTVVAGVCRPDWLVEVEGIAIVPH